MHRWQMDYNWGLHCFSKVRLPSPEKAALDIYLEATLMNVLAILAVEHTVSTDALWPYKVVKVNVLASQVAMSQAYSADGEH